MYPIVDRLIDDDDVGIEHGDKGRQVAARVVGREAGHARVDEVEAAIGKA